MNVIWTERADRDLVRHWLYLADINQAYPERVEARLNEAASLLGRFPYLGRLVRRTIRDLSVPDVQHVVRYR